ncbi:MAG TPA: PTS sugar transporter subunit IIB [Anaeromyxobacteraceae bacterium]|nr:PTS sugar transporter subunit IIB [Anaeromyxobacteraceae bacterium]
MIALVRIDNRLIHGQILEAWTPRLRIGQILVADDEAARSKLARAAMTLCLPPGLSAEVLPIDEVDFGRVASSPARTLLLFREVVGVQRAVAGGLSPALARTVNVGNVHYAPGRRPVTPSVFLTEQEVQTVQQLAALGFEVEARAIPTDAPAGARELAQRYACAPEKR